MSPGEKRLRKREITCRSFKNGMLNAPMVVFEHTTFFSHFAKLLQKHNFCDFKKFKNGKSDGPRLLGLKKSGKENFPAWKK
jgi:hypothetical protein